MASQAKYLTGDKEGIKEFIDKFDVSLTQFLWFASVAEMLFTLRT